MKDLTGQRFGRWTVIKYAGFENSNYRWLCKCDCGNEKTVSQSSLKQGTSLSCGCLARELAKEKVKHGLCRVGKESKLYWVYNSMIQRCNNPKDTAYKYYGGRGIKVCDEWANNRTSFFEWAYKNGYTEGLTIDRINTNGNYEPSNCRWSDRYVQLNNTRRNHYLTLNGRTLTVKQWCVEYNIDPKLVYWRVKQGKTFEEAITTPVRKIKKKGEFDERVCTKCG